MKWAERLPEPLKTIWRYWMAFGKLMSKIINGILLTIVFLVVLPFIALAQRLSGKDVLDLHAAQGAKGWKPRRRPSEELWRAPATCFDPELHRFGLPTGVLWPGKSFTPAPGR